MKKTLLFFFVWLTSAVCIAQNGYRVEIKQVFPKSTTVYSNAFNFKREMDNAIANQTAKLNGNNNYQILITTPSGNETRNVQNINWIQSVNGSKSYHSKKTLPKQSYDNPTVWECYACNIDGSRKSKAEKKEFIYRVALSDDPTNFKTAFVEFDTAEKEANSIVEAASQEELVEAIIFRYDSDVPLETDRKSNVEQHDAYLAKLNAETPTQNIVAQNTKKEQYATQTKEPKQSPVVKKDPRLYFFTVNGAYTNPENPSVGLTFGQVNSFGKEKRLGWFASVMSGFNYAGFNTSLPVSDANGIVGEDLPFYKDEYAKTVFSIIGGGVIRVYDLLYVKAGLGYGNRSLSWKTIDDRWVRNGGYSAVGLDASVGAMCIYKGFVVSLDGVVTTNFGNAIFEGRIGIGYSF